MVADRVVRKSKFTRDHLVGLVFHEQSKDIFLARREVQPFCHLTLNWRWQFDHMLAGQPGFDALHYGSGRAASDQIRGGSCLEVLVRFGRVLMQRDDNQRYRRQFAAYGADGATVICAVRNEIDDSRYRVRA